MVDIYLWLQKAIASAQYAIDLCIDHWVLCGMTVAYYTKRDWRVICQNWVSWDQVQSLGALGQILISKLDIIILSSWSWCTTSCWAIVFAHNTWATTSTSQGNEFVVDWVLRVAINIHETCHAQVHQRTLMRSSQQIVDKRSTSTRDSECASRECVGWWRESDWLLLEYDRHVDSIVCVAIEFALRMSVWNYISHDSPTHSWWLRLLSQQEV